MFNVMPPRSPIQAHLDVAFVEGVRGGAPDDEGGLETILTDDPSPEGSSDPAAAPSPGGETLTDLVASVEAELAGEKPKEDVADPAAPAAPATDPATTRELAETKAELANLKQIVESFSAPPAPDAEAVEKALEAEIRADEQVVNLNREIEAVEADIKFYQTANTALYKQLGEAQDSVAEFRGQAKVVGEDLKPSIQAKAEAEQARVTRIQSEIASNLAAAKRAETDKRYHERRLVERVDLIRDDASRRVEQEAGHAARVRADNAAFNYALESVAKGLKVPISKFDKDMIRAAVVSILHNSPGPRLSPEQIGRVAAVTTRKYLVANGRTAGARAVALAPSKAPSAPRPADERIAPAPARTTTAVKPTAEQENDPEYWKRRRDLIRQRAAQGAQARR